MSNANNTEASAYWLVGGVVLLRPLGAYGARLGVMLAVVGLLAENAYLVVMCRRHVLPILTCPAVEEVVQTTRRGE